MLVGGTETCFGSASEEQKSRDIQGTPDRCGRLASLMAKVESGETGQSFLGTIFLQENLRIFRSLESVAVVGSGLRTPRIPPLPPCRTS